MRELDAQVQEWVYRLSEPAAHLNGLSPCPFALNALRIGKVRVNERRGWPPIIAIFRTLSTWNDSAEIVIDALDAPDRVSTTGLWLSVEVANLISRFFDLKTVEDHPYYDTESRLPIAFGHRALVMTQRKSSLRKAGEILTKRGYYAN